MPASSTSMYLESDIIRFGNPDSVKSRHALASDVSALDDGPGAFDLNDQIQIPACFGIRLTCAAATRQSSGVRSHT